MISVRRKISIARGLNRILRCTRGLVGKGMQTRARREGLTWELDLNEGIDLSIYLLGAYEPRTLRAYRSLLRAGAVVFDVGANIGAHTLHFAQLVGSTGKVFAFEPTDFAFAKLQRNMALNPAVASSIRAQQMFLVGSAHENVPTTIYSSWPVSAPTTPVHEGHCGALKNTAGARHSTGDDFCQAERIERLDLIKIDVDGHEASVIQGFEKSLRRFRPNILIELAPFIHAPSGDTQMNDFVQFLADLGYEFFEVNSGNPLPTDPIALRRHIGQGAGINALLRHPGGRR